MATMLVGGLWHGASWTFVAWGAYHGVLLWLERLVRAAFGQRHIATPVRALLAAATFAAVCVGWVFFRAPDFPRAFAILKAMFGFESSTQPLLAVAVHFAAMAAAIAIALLVLSHALLRSTTLEEAARRTPGWLHSGVIAVMWLLVLMAPKSDRAFIYFQF